MADVCQVWTRLWSFQVGRPLGSVPRLILRRRLQRNAQRVVGSPGRARRRCGQDRSRTHDRWPRTRARCGRAVPRPHVGGSVCARHRRRSRDREDDHLAGGGPSSSGARVLGPGGTTCPERSKAVVRWPRRPDRRRLRGNEGGASACSATGPCGGAAARGRRRDGRPASDGNGVGRHPERTRRGGAGRGGDRRPALARSCIAAGAGLRRAPAAGSSRAAPHASC
jgi:hypothetical protein